MEETVIIANVLAGDIEEYAQLVERYRTGLIIYCERYVVGRADAEDIAQKAFIKAYEQLGTYDTSKSRFSTWVVPHRDQLGDRLASYAPHGGQS